MHFYQHNIKTFNSATRFLTRVERSIYRDLIDLYYDTEEPLTSDLKRLSRLVIVASEEEKEALYFVLEEFFVLEDGVYRHDYIDTQILEYHKQKQLKSKAGKASVKSRRDKKTDEIEHNLTPVEHNLTPVEQNLTPVEQNLTPVEHPLNTCTTNHKPETINQKPLTNGLKKQAKKNRPSKSNPPKPKPKPKPPNLASNEFEQGLVDYRRAIGKPLRTRTGVVGLVNALENCAKDWGCKRAEVFEFMQGKEWLSIDPSYQNPFKNGGGRTFDAGITGSWMDDLGDDVAEQPSALLRVC